MGMKLCSSVVAVFMSNKHMWESNLRVCYLLLLLLRVGMLGKYFTSVRSVFLLFFSLV